MQPFIALISLLALIGGGAATGTVSLAPESGPLDLNPMVAQALAGAPASRAVTVAAQPRTPSKPFAGLSGGAAAAYGAGTVLHVQTPTSAVEMGLSQASFSTGALPDGQDELSHPLPSLAPGAATARGRALEIRSAGSETTPDAVEPAEAAAPPTKEPVSVQKDVAVMKLFEANSLAASAGARAVQGGCVIGSNIAFGIGSATDTSLADVKNDPKSDAPLLALHVGDPPPPRAVSQSQSRTFLAPAADGGPGFGLVAQTRQTIAPITLAEGTDNQLLIELGGEWVLSVFTDGKESKVTFGPDPKSLAGKDDKWPVLRIVQGQGNKKKLLALTLGDVTGENGKKVVNIDGGDVTVGENPRALGDEDGVQNPISTPTLAAAAADVVRIRTASDDVRIGHMEAAATVPVGGVQCPGIGLGKRSVPETIRAGEKFSWDITVSNPNDCILRNVKLVDTATTTPGVKFTVKTTSPRSTVAPDGTLTFEGLGELPLGTTRSVRIEAVLPEDAPAGGITNALTAVGACSGVNRTGSTSSKTTVEPLEKVPVPAPPPGIAAGGAGGGGSRVSAGTAETYPAAAPVASSPTTDKTRGDTRTAQAQAGGSGASSSLARTGGLFGLALAGPLLGLGSLLRRRARRIGRRSS